MKRVIFPLLLIAILFSIGLLKFTTMSSDSLPPSLTLLGGGAKWAAGNGSQALFVNWKDNWLAHHSTDGADWHWGSWITSNMDDWRYTISSTLLQYGFDVEFAADIPETLEGFDVVVLSAYYAIEPQHNQQMREYISNGGGVVLLKGVPCFFPAYDKDLWTTTNLRSIQDWFGASRYANTNGDAIVTIGNPFGTDILDGFTLIEDVGPSAAAIIELNETAQIVAQWESGEVCAFSHEFGLGRVYYQAAFDVLSDDTSPPPEPPPPPDSEVTVRVIPEVVDLGVGSVVGEEFTVAVAIENVWSLMGFDVKFSWDDTYLEYVEHTRTIPIEDFPEPIPPSPYAGILHEPTLHLMDEACDDWLWCAAATLGNSFTGNGTLFTITLRVKNQLDSPVATYLAINSSDLASPNGGVIEHEVIHGLVMIPGLSSGYLGDIDEDGDVDIFDMVILSDAYGSGVGEPGYNPKCDLDEDDRVCIFDIVIASENYGKS